MLALIIKILSKIFFFTGLIGGKNGFSKPLKPEEEKALFQKLSNGDKLSEEKLVKHNLRLVAYIAKKYKNYNDQDELISVGSVGLLKAVRSYNVESGNNFSTYASRCIENEILMLFRSEKKHSQDVSLFDPVGVDKEGNALTLFEILAEPEENGVGQKVEKKLLGEKVNRIINSCLDAREREVISRRYGINGFTEQTQNQTSVAMGISRSYVSRIEKTAIIKIRNEITAEILQK